MGNQVIFQNIWDLKKPDPLPELPKERDVPPPIPEVIRPYQKDLILLPPMRELIEVYANQLSVGRRGYTPIHVDEISSKIARFYEMIRKVIDWKEDSALRRSAIERTLKRILFPRLSGFTLNALSPNDLAETVTKELIRGGHLPNDTIPYERVGLLSQALEKYFYFLDHPMSKQSPNVKQKINNVMFILEIAACEIEELLTNPIKEYGVIDAMTIILADRTQLIPADVISVEEKNKRVYIAVCQTLYDLDDNFVIYQLLKSRYSFWHHPDRAQMDIIANELFPEAKKIQSYIESPLMRKFVVIAEKIDTIFLLLDDVLEKLKDNPKEIVATFEDKKKLKPLLEESYEKRYKTLKKRLFRLAIFSTLSVFLSNWFTFFLVEVPLAHVFYEGFNLLASIVDFVIPTVVMFLLVIIIRPPKAENAKKVVAAATGFIYQDEKQEHFQIRADNPRFSVFSLVMAIMYICTMLIVFGIVAYLFYIARLPITSVIFDTFTIALTVFAAVTIRNKSKELTIDEHTGIRDFILDVFSVPIAKVGSILAAKWKEYNVISILFNFVVETPFAIVLYFIDRWSEFIKERRAELH